MSTTMRSTLGDFNSVVCLKAIIIGVEDTLGPDGAAVVFTRAGKVRGEQLASSLGLTNTHPSPEDLARVLDQALGVEGTRLCRVKGAHAENGTVVVETDETVCSAGEPAGSTRTCTFTLGAVWGALEAASGKRYQAKHTESVLRGGSSDKFVFTEL